MGMFILPSFTMTTESVVVVVVGGVVVVVVIVEEGVKALPLGGLMRRVWVLRSD